MGRLSHCAAEELAALTEAGVRISEAERMLLELHFQECEACAERHVRLTAFVTAVRAAAPIQQVHGSDRELIARAMMQAGGPPKRLASRGTAQRWLHLAAAAALFIVFGLGATALYRQTHSGEQAQAVAHSGPPEKSPPLPAAATASVPGTSPSLTQPCPGVLTRPHAHTKVSIAVQEAQLCRLFLAEGGLDVHVDPKARTRVSVDTPSASVRVVGTVFRVLARSSDTTVSVYRGHVVVETDRDSIGLGAGEQVLAVRSDAAPKAQAMTPQTRAELADFAGDSPPETQARKPILEPKAAPRGQARATDGRDRVRELRTLLQTGKTREARAAAQSRSEQPEYQDRKPELLTLIAESYVMEGEYERALDTYSRVWGGTKSATAANALIAAANLSLQRSSHGGEALALYERYLREYPGGSLRELAVVGRCRALQRAEQLEQAVSCAQAYLATHPNGRFRDPMQALTE